MSLTLQAQGPKTPIAVPDVAFVYENAILAGSSVLTNDKDENKASLIAVLVTAPEHGTLVFHSDGTYTYTPAPNYVGADAFYYKAVNENNVESKAVRVRINIWPGLIQTIPVDDYYAVDEGGMVQETTPGLMVNDSYGPLVFPQVQLETSPLYGNLVIQADGSFHYTHDGSETITDSFTYSLITGATTSASATVFITIYPVNDAPLAQAQDLSTAEDTPLSLSLSGADAEGDALTYTLLTPPTHGSLSGTAPALVYTPFADYFGPDGFSYVVNDGQAESAPATVSLSITPLNDTPQALAQTVESPEDTPFAIRLSATDVDDDPLSYTLSSSPAHGTLSGTAPNLVYTPFADYNGPDAFTFTASDGVSVCSAATVSINITPVNDAPIAISQALGTQEDVPLSLVLSGTDVEGDGLIYTIVTATAQGTLSGTAPTLVYTPEPNYQGTDVFSFQVSDGTATSATATVSISVAPVNDIPLALSQILSTPEDVVLPILLSGSDVEGSELVFTLHSLPLHGTLSGVAPNLLYTPAANYAGADAFSFTVSDGEETSAPATIALSITPVNDAPLALAQELTTQEDVTLSLQLSATDAEADLLTYSILTGPAKGSLSGVAPDMTYTPVPDVNGSDTFTFTVSDGVLSTTATITLTILPENDTPQAQDQNLATPEEVPLSITLTAADVDGDALSYQLLSSPAHGSVSGAAPALVYTPFADYNGADSFSFRVHDGTNYSAPATINLTVGAVNDAPQAIDQSLQTAEDAPLSILLTGTDAEGAALIYTLTSAPANGTLSGSSPALVYTPSANFFGHDSFTFTVSDGQLHSLSATVALQVTPVNDAPQALAQTITTLEDEAVAISLAGTDVENSPLSFTILSGPSHGTFAAGIYTPFANYDGADSFIFSASDGVLSSAPATITILIEAVNDAPTTQNQALTTPEEVALPISLSATDPEGDALTYSLITSPQHGSLSGTLPDLVYTPFADYTGSDLVTFRVHDGSTYSQEGSIQLTVTPVNDAPVALDQALQTDEDTPLAIVLGGQDAETEALEFTVSSLPAHGTLSGTAPAFTYTPYPNFAGTDAFSFTVTDGSLTSAVATVALTVHAINDAPQAAALAVETDEDVALAISLAGTDVDGDALSITLSSAPQRGTFIGGIYTPDPDFNGTDMFSYTVSDGQQTSAPATVSITVRPVNDAPFATSQTHTTPENTALAILLSGSDVDGDALTYTILDAPTGGTLSGTPPALTYTPSVGFNGSDGFTYRVFDGTLYSAAATITLTVSPVNDGPQAHAQEVDTDEDTPLSISLSGADADGDALSYTITSNPAHGTLSGTAPAPVYTPAPDFFGSDSFSYSVSDGALQSAPAVVHIGIRPVNDAPRAADDAATGTEDTPLAGATVLTNDTDVDDITLVAVLVQGPAHGTLTLAANGTYVYHPQPDFTGADSFTYKAQDAAGAESAPATVSLAILPVNDAPTALAQLLSTAEDVALSITLTGTDPEESPLGYTLLRAPAHGTLSGAAPTLTYTPHANYSGTDSFDFTVNDGDLQAAAATITITVSPVNDKPQALTQTLTTDEDQPLALSLSGTDTENNPLTFSVVSGPAHGSYEGGIYTPQVNYHGTDSFTFTATDGELVSEEATIHLTILPVNDTPAAADQTLTTPEDVALPLTLTGSDVEGDALQFTIVDQPATGVLSGTAPALTYTPAADFNGSDAFTYRVSDGQATSELATITISVTPVNDPPLALFQALQTAEDTPLALTLTGIDAEGTLLTYTLVEGTAHGSLGGSTPNLVYTPSADFNGTDALTFTVSDGARSSATATISIQITPVNDAPLAQADSYAVEQGATLQVTVPGVLANDADVEASTLTALLVSAPTHGSLQLQPNGSFTYQHNGSATTADSFSYSPHDGELAGEPVTVQINIQPAEVDQPPLAGNDSYLGRENEQLSGNVLQNDSDPKSLALTVATSLLVQPAHGSVVLQADGTFIYTPAPGFHGEDRFTYSVCNAASSCASAVVSLLIRPYDSDGDGIPDVVEWGPSETSPVDTDGDSTADYLDLDSDNDGLEDRLEAGSDPTQPADTDGDGLADYRDYDSDGDGKTDAEEGQGDCDADGILNYLDSSDPCAEKILISQGFSPNGDGQNDVWQIYLIENFPANKIQVFNRWGALVFALEGYNNADKAWAGESNHGTSLGSARLTDGTYFYLINLGDGTPPYTGYVVIKR